MKCFFMGLAALALSGCTAASFPVGGLVLCVGVKDCNVRLETPPPLTPAEKAGAAAAQVAVELLKRRGK